MLKFLSYSLFSLIIFVFDLQAKVSIDGNMQQWHRLSLTFDGPQTSENDPDNPFTNYRLDVTFTHNDISYNVPGFYAADGNSGESGAAEGNKWRVFFTPDRTGEWSYKASFRTGDFLSVSLDDGAGKATAFDGSSGTFMILKNDVSQEENISKGMLRYVGQHYLQYAGSGEYYIKGGADSPENFLAYFEFDQTPVSHRYEAHSRDWREGDPTWQDGKGKNIIASLNYLASKGMNSVYMITMNVMGDGKDVWPWIDSSERYRFDCSKLAQWEIVFSQMDKLGIMIHLLLSEAENKNIFEWEELKVKSEGFAQSRRLYYRELIARFAHHLAITWNLGEENNMPAGNNAQNYDASFPNSDDQRKLFAEYIRSLDPYDHPIVVHNSDWDLFPPLYGNANFEGPSMQVHDPKDVHVKTLEYVTQSAKNEKKWFVCIDENGHYTTGAKPDKDDPQHDRMRKEVLWANLMAGGAGVEWYFGYKYEHNDLTCEDWRSRDKLWDQTRYALDFFHDYLPFWEMKPNDDLLASDDAYCFAQEGKIYAVYLPGGGTTQINLKSNNVFTIHWFNPRTGSKLETGTKDIISGSGFVALGNPPYEEDKDWVVLIK